MSKKISYFFSGVKATKLLSNGSHESITKPKDNLIISAVPIFNFCFVGVITFFFFKFFDIMDDMAPTFASFKNPKCIIGPIKNDRDGLNELGDSIEVL